MNCEGEGALLKEAQGVLFGWEAAWKKVGKATGCCSRRAAQAFLMSSSEKAAKTMYACTSLVEIDSG
jgi:hypothetical protein